MNWLTGNYDPDKLYKDMQKNVDMINTDFQQNTGEQMFDANSQYNRGILGAMKQGTYDQMALNSNLAGRQAAMGNQFGANQRNMQANATAGEQLSKGFNQWMGQAGQLGSGLLGQAMQGQMQNQQIKQSWAEAAAQQKAQNAANIGGLWQGAIGGLLGSAGNFMQNRSNQNFMRDMFGGNAQKGNELMNILGGGSGGSGMSLPAGLPLG